MVLPVNNSGEMHKTLSISTAGTYSTIHQTKETIMHQAKSELADLYNIPMTLLDTFSSFEILSSLSAVKSNQENYGSNMDTTKGRGQALLKEINSQSEKYHMSTTKEISKNDEQQSKWNDEKNPTSNAAPPPISSPLPHPLHTHQLAKTQQHEVEKMGHEKHNERGDGELDAPKIKTEPNLRKGDEIQIDHVNHRNMRDHPDEQKPFETNIMNTPTPHELIRGFLKSNLESVENTWDKLQGKSEEGEKSTHRREGEPPSHKRGEDPPTNKPPKKSESTQQSNENEINTNGIAFDKSDNENFKNISTEQQNLSTEAESTINEIINSEEPTA